MAARQRDISVSEFFTKNRHLLGFDNPRKALLTTIKEAVDNSLDACEEAGILPDLIVEIEELEETRYRIAVQDNGPGIAPDDVDRIFDLHFTTRHGRVEFGLGLGLRIARDIVSQHDGSITVASIPGRTTFTVTLPVRQDGERVATVSNAEGETP